MLFLRFQTGKCQIYLSVTHVIHVTVNAWKLDEKCSIFLFQISNQNNEIQSNQQLEGSSGFCANISMKSTQNR